MTPLDQGNIETVEHAIEHICIKYLRDEPRIEKVLQATLDEIKLLSESLKK